MKALSAYAATLALVLGAATESRADLFALPGFPDYPEHMEYPRYILELERLWGGSLPDDPALRQVTDEFGPSVIPLHALPLRSSLADTGARPWSSWWFPKFERTLFERNGSQAASPLGKYDRYRQERARKQRAPEPASAAAWEAARFNPAAFRWEGLCDAWAIASLSYPEPVKPVHKRFGRFLSGDVEIEFSVADLKGLLLKTLESVDEGVKVYGQRFTGDWDGWVQPDPFPEQFHRFIEVMLFEKGEPFVMDYDAGVEVWSVPVFKANYLMERAPNIPNAVVVTMWLYTGKQSHSFDGDLPGAHEAIREYRYLLKGNVDAQGRLHATDGEWLKGSMSDSRKDHPDFFVRIPDPAKLRHHSLNPEIDLDTVRELLAEAL